MERLHFNLTRWWSGRKAILVGGMLLLFLTVPIFAQSGGPYNLSWWTIDSGGGANFSSDSRYTLIAAIGQPEAGPTASDDSGQYTLTGGFLVAGIDSDQNDVATIYIQPGWNYISLPLKPITLYTAEAACDEINNQGGSLVEINRWFVDDWDSHICGETANDFSLTLSAGYFIFSNDTSVWTLEGQQVTTAVPLDLQIGWNAIGLPHTDTYTAESLCAELGSQGVTVEQIDRWYAGGWDSHPCGLPFNDFPIEIGSGYRVWVTSAGVVVPAAVSSLKVTPLTPTDSSRVYLPIILK